MTEVQAVSGDRQKLHRLLPHRYGPAPARGVAVVRQTQLRRLTAASLTHRLTLLRAPSGAGKTTLLGQWLEVLKETGRAVAWLSLEDEDTRPAALIDGLINAFGDNGRNPAATSASFAALTGDLLKNADLTTSASARRLAAAFNELGLRGVLILDRFETIDGTPSGALVATLLQHLTSMNLVIACRNRPASLPLSHLRARDELAELTASDLHLDLAEVKALFGDDMPDQYARKLHHMTDGAPIALQFARRAIDALPDESTRKTGRAGSAPGWSQIDPINWLEWLDDYYNDEILGVLQPDMRHVMNRLVIVERFDLSLAEAIAGPEARQLVNRLHYELGLLTRDRFTGQFHFPETLRQFLEKRLQWFDEAEQKRLHARAAAWFMERGQAFEALHHAVQSDSTSMASGLLEQLGVGTIAVRNGLPSLKRMMSRFTPKAGRVNPQARLAWSLIRAHEGGLSEACALLDQAKADMTADPDRPPPATAAFDCALTEGLIDGFTDRHMPDAARAAIKRELERIPANEHAQRALLHILLSWDAFRRGQLDEADRGVNAAATEYAAADGVYAAIFMNIHRTLIRFWRNDLAGARAECLIAERMAHLFFPADDRLRLLTMAIKSALLFDLDPDIQPPELLELASEVCGLEAWCEVLLWTCQFSAAAALRQGRLDMARKILDHGARAAERLNIAKLGWAIACERAEIEALHGDITHARNLAETLCLAHIDSASIENIDLTWRERIGGLLTYGQILRREGRLEDAAEIADRAARALAVTPIPRLAARLAIFRAHLARARGQDSAARRYLEEARATFPDLVSRQLFLEQDLVAGNTGQKEQAGFAAFLDTAGRAAEKEREDQSPAAGIMVTTYGSLSGATATPDPLTAREREILQSMREGHPNKVTAYHLGLSEATVKFHLRNIYRKLDARNRTQALARYNAIMGTPYGML